MKKLITTFIAVSCIYTFAQAQQSKGVEFGVGIGYNGATVSNSNNQSTDVKSGFNAAVSFDNYFSNRWSIKAKVIYDQKGWNNGYIEDDNGTYTTDFNLNYVTVPVMASWHFGNTRNWYLEFGPYFGFLLNAEETRFGTDVTDGFNENDMGLALGIGVKIPLNN